MLSSSEFHQLDQVVLLGKRNNVYCKATAFSDRFLDRIHSVRIYNEARWIQRHLSECRGEVYFYAAITSRTQDPAYTLDARIPNCSARPMHRKGFIDLIREAVLDVLCGNRDETQLCPLQRECGHPGQCVLLIRNRWMPMHL